MRGGGVRLEQMGMPEVTGQRQRTTPAGSVIVRSTSWENETGAANRIMQRNVKRGSSREVSGKVGKRTCENHPISQVARCSTCHRIRYKHRRQGFVFLCCIPSSKVSWSAYCWVGVGHVLVVELRLEWAAFALFLTIGLAP